MIFDDFLKRNRLHIELLLIYYIKMFGIYGANVTRDGQSGGGNFRSGPGLLSYLSNDELNS